jgi:hypothetical protein
MPKITRSEGPSVAGLTEVNTPTEAEYSEAMDRHGSDRFTEDDAATVRAWLDHQTRNHDPHAAPTVVEDAAADDASTKASEGPDAKGYADRVLEGAQTSAERVDAKAKADADDDEDSSTDEGKPVDNGPASAKLPPKATGTRTRNN